MATNIFDQAFGNVGQAGNTLTDLAAGGAPLESANSYINPYQQQVIGNTVDQMRQQHAMNMQGVGDSAIASGAFGGSRHGLVESQMTDDYMRSVGDTVSSMNQSGFNLAQQLGLQATGQQMNAANSLFGVGQGQYGMGRGIQQDQLAQGNQQQQLMQSVLDLANQDLGGYMNHPTNSIANVLQAVSGSPLSGNVTQTTKPGLFDYLGLGAQVVGGSKIGGGK